MTFLTHKPVIILNIIGIIFELISFCSFFILSNYGLNKIYIYCTIVILFILFIVIAWDAIKKCNWIQLFASSVFLSFFFLILFNFVGFLLFQGLVKDLRFLSLSHVLNMIVVLFVSSIFFSTTLFISKFIQMKTDI